MTDETQGPTPEEAPAPPASTRWSEDPVQDDDTPPPPFVPGREAAAPAAETPVGEAPTSETPAPDVPADADEPFPFDVVDDMGEDEATAAEVAADEAPEGEDDFPFEQFDIEGKAPLEAATDEADVVEVEPEVEAENAGWTPADLDLGDADEVTTEVAPDDTAEEVAAVLDRIAGLLRDEGEGAVRREMEAPDRLTAVLAGVVAGYLSGRS